MPYNPDLAEYLCDACNVIVSLIRTPDDPLCPICNSSYLEECCTQEMGPITFGIFGDDNPYPPHPFDSSSYYDTHWNPLGVIGAWIHVHGNSDGRNVQTGANFSEPFGAQGGGGANFSEPFGAQGGGGANLNTLRDNRVWTHALGRGIQTGANFSEPFGAQGGGGVVSGDYFVGPGLEQFIQQLPENDPNRYGTPPALRTAIDNLPDITIDEVMISDYFQCAVCMDSFEIGGIGKQMPCKHMYHKECILPWLELHNSCPLCRFELPTDDPEYENRAREFGEGSGGAGEGSGGAGAGAGSGSGGPTEENLD